MGDTAWPCELHPHHKEVDWISIRVDKNSGDTRTETSDVVKSHLMIEDIEGICSIH
jgi:hypothetical protein